MTTRKIAIDVPESVLLAEKTDERAFARELRMLAAVKLYELGRLSSGRAAELAGMARVGFSTRRVAAETSSSSRTANCGSLRSRCCANCTHPASFLHSPNCFPWSTSISSMALRLASFQRASPRPRCG